MYPGAIMGHLRNSRNEAAEKSPCSMGKPSISMGHLYHGYVIHNQMVIHLPKPEIPSESNFRRSLDIKQCFLSPPALIIPDLGLSET
jgi:hypothetical protein